MNGAMTLSGGLWSLPSLENLSAYTRAVNAAPMLSAQREDWLAKELLGKGSVEAAGELVWAHLRLVVKIAREHAGYGLAQADLIQEGNVGLMMAVKKFDPAHGARLAAYAAVWIRSEIQEYILSNWRMVKIGSAKGLRKLFFNFRRLQEKLAGEAPLTRRSEISKTLGVREAEVDLAAEWFSGSDAPLLEDASDEEVHGAILRAPQAWEPSEQVERERRERDLPKRLTQALEDLTPREREVIQARFLLPEGPETLSEVGLRLGVSLERARQIESSALRKMREGSPTLRELI